MDYLSPRLDLNNQEPFLNHAILDLPNPSDYFEILGKTMHPFGKLITFSPSVTKLVECLQLVEEQDLPFMLEKAIEVGAGFGSGGREWDIRTVLPRMKQRKTNSVENAAKKSLEETEEELGVEVEVESPEAVGASDEPHIESSVDKNKEGREIVCRPKVGIRVEGGGFMAVWRRKYFREEGPPEIQEM